MIGVIVPAHNEEAFIGRALQSLLAAATHPALKGEAVEITVVMDDCADGTALIVQAHQVHGLAVQLRNVGRARAAGAEHMLARGARWLAFTDADTVVPSHWLADQLRFGTDAVCGTVRVDDWSAHGESVRARYDAHYTPVEGHRHIHGANLGVAAQAYRQAGGFRPLRAHEDVHLIADLEAVGASITWTTINCVVTSSRLDCRCQEGFGDYLRSLAQETLGAA
jgi:glycosyltransferase involved in cell wall biosynthesis